MAAAPDVLSVVVPASGIPGPPQGRWTYADYAAIPDDGNRYEVIDGVLYAMPAPTIVHQIVVGAIFFYLKQHIDLAGRGRVRIAPIDVELMPGADAVQPDVIAILTANLGIITPSHVAGAPDLVVEVASPSTAGYDRREKQDAYARAGVFQGQALLPSLVVPEASLVTPQLIQTSSGTSDTALTAEPAV